MSVVDHNYLKWVEAKRRQQDDGYMSIDSKVILGLGYYKTPTVVYGGLAAIRRLKLREQKA